ncbi:MAG TPA: hypothetical protein VHH90_08615 [Polyangia bacterium]|nr:hypothetical protein [Polyangia bacterium]
MRDFSLRRINSETVLVALERARSYRLANDPQQAESICLDILAIDPAHHEALTTLILALADQFSTRSDLFERTRSLAAGLHDEYERLYLSGLIAEREARAISPRGLGAGFARGLLLTAIELYERAEAIRPANNIDSILRRNGCLRIMQAEGLESVNANASGLDPSRAR